MKKKSIFFVLFLSIFMLIAAGCGSNNASEPKKEDPKEEKKEEANKKEEAVTGASEEGSYTPYEELKDSYDIVIIGAGGAGMTAALEAKAAGMNPVILEKMPVAGGNTSKSSSGMNASQTKFQTEKGITDSNDKFYEETLKGGKGTNNPEMLRYFVDNSASAIDWLDSIGIRLNNITITGGMSVERTHRPEDGSAVGQYLVAGLVRNVEEQKIPLFVNADVKEVTEKDGKVNGVKVVFNGKDKKTITAKAVVVASGGFGANMDMIEKVRPDLAGYVTTNQEGSTGDGIKMIEDLGGTTVDLEQIQVHPTVQQENSYLIGEVVRGEGAILVNAEGTRFHNEMDTRDNVTAAINALPEQNAWLVFDSGVKSRAKAIEQYEKKGFTVKGDTIEALAEQMKVPADALKASLDTWNTAVTNKSDAEFGRTTAMDNALTGAPYYAIKIGPGIHYTMGGVVINTNTEVLTKDGQPIPGLFAAGEVTGGLHGQNRIGGNSVGEIIVFGRQAGIKSAEFVKAQ